MAPRPHHKHNGHAGLRSGSLLALLFVGCLRVLGPPMRAQEPPPPPVDSGGASPPVTAHRLPEAPRPTRANPPRNVLGIHGAALKVRIDGDEVELRLLGTYVPHDELVNVEPYLKRLLADEQVWVEAEPGWPERDREGRLWAYVYRVPDGLCVNLELIRLGYARLSAAEQFTHQGAFRAYEAAARRARKGLWAPARTPPDEEALAAPKPAERVANTRPAALGAAQPADHAPPDPDATLVHVTQHGKRYHRAECQFARNGTAVTLREARNRGCTPCTRCKPPQ